MERNHVFIYIQYIIAKTERKRVKKERDRARERERERERKEKEGKEKRIRRSKHQNTLPIQSKIKEKKINRAISSL